ncbi:MAG: UDP-forming cellulose synthase catalytic subunit [Alphaproteobacteria bacterium]|nr:UDP-forming cellulose synthase catalytic subunit [Alphaproteobacteria bacterium]MBV9860836.1 UDP-forming cellulose synthase catalytic subunit [Alphaproteobacteria bacterium]
MAGIARRFAGSEFAGQNLVMALLVVLGAILLAIVIVTPLDLVSQALFAIITIVAMMIIKASPSRGVTLILVTLSIVVSTRYLWWRFTDTLSFASMLEAFLGIGLVLAELYAWMVLVLGYIQTVWPLRRHAVPMPEDLALWPTVDLFIPTYNEPLAVVQNTVFGALSVDYPLDKLKIYILDDGRREEFREFAEAVGVGYITREDNLHAKAGNLNHALSVTNGELLALFDSDHVPTRAFLQLTIGWFLVDPRLSLVQTPHHFYSPDPFERNLRGGTTVPNEGQLFYGLIQDGNDLWNAAFFCGSCAVIRRSAVQGIGGFATATVTEDAHTALRMHRAGWNSAYLRLPLAAGLATERLALHVGQRMRWARGMTQIFRLDNPMFGRGLTFGQRICYLNAMMHFFFGLPRFVFLTAPLAYLLFQLNIIAASGLMIVAYAAPHLIHSTVTTSRLQSRYRHSFWGEIYESVLALYILRPTLSTLINPKRGKFNVTEKGGLLPQDYFDYKIVRPHLVIAALLILALIVALFRWLFTDLSDTDLEVLALNVAWAIFNLLTIAAAIAAGRETRQLRSSVRLGLVMPAVIYLPSGRTIVTQSRNLSTTGGMFTAPVGNGVAPGEMVQIELPIGERMSVLPARVVAWEGDVLRVQFDELTLRQQRDLVRIVLGRADAWLDWEEHPIDRPLRSVREILVSIGGLFVPHRRRALAPGVVRAAPIGPQEPPPRSPRERVTSSLLVVLGLAALMTSGTALAQAPGRGAPPPVAAPSPGAAAGAAAPPPQGSQVPVMQPTQLVPGALPPQSQTPPNQPGLPGPATPTPMPGAPVAATPGAPGHGSTRQESFSLRALGANSPIRLIGVQGEGSLPFSIRRDELVTGGRATLAFAYSPALIPELSHLTVLLNGEVLGSIPLPKDRNQGTTAELAINPLLFQADNRILFRFIGHYTLGCEDPLHSSLWLVLSNNSFLTVQLEKLPLPNELSLLPAPFYDPKDLDPLVLPFVFSAHPSLPTLQAAGTVASWFGSLAAYKGASFPTSLDAIPPRDAVVFATPSEAPAGLALPQITGPTISVMTNPGNPEAKLLLVLGRNADELRAAADTLALGSVALSGQTQVVGVPDIAQRRPYDAPRWVPIDRAVRFGELVQPTDLQGNGLVPGLLTLNFRTAPDLFVWRDTGVPLDIRYRYPAGTWMNFRDSRLDVSINNSYLRSLPLTQESAVQQVRDIISPDYVMNEQSLRIPPYYVFGQNQLQFYYDLRPEKRGECQDVLPTNVQESIDPDSTIDMSKTERFTTMPNLAFFANSGYPFTRMADLGDTAIVLPDQLTAQDIEAFLTLMGLMGDSTGFPVVRSTLVTAAQVDQVSGKDLIVLGSISRQPLLARWAENGRLRVENGHLRVGVTSAIDRVYTALDPNAAQERDRVDQLLVAAGDDLAAMIGMRSPLNSGRSVVIITGSSPDKLLTVISTFRNRDLNPLIQGDLMVRTGNKVTSFRVGNQYTVGHLPFFTKIRWWLGDSPLILILFTLIGVLIIALVAYWLLSRLAAIRLRPRPVP